ncbi:phosphatidylserine decarboxylase proenzyme 1, mitochondrial [Typha angustifolia]|uniref:phosphatidylserine decarboxylase proenzyme 1, mitochondrial n=1 Tax=Typha angustifolia TaxID=59011 RepID=UPI003C302006
MRFRVSPRWPLFPPHHFRHHRFPYPALLRPTTLSRSLHATPSSFNAGNSGGGAGGRQSNFLLVPGATMATILMLGILHARRLYDDKKLEDMKEKGIDPELLPDTKAAFLRILPLRSISRFWGFLMTMEVPVLLRPFIYKSWARAFHSDLEEAALPLEDYASLQEFFVRSLKEGSRPINADLNCLVSPVDGKILRLGEVKGPGAMIEQVKGFSYSASSLLGANSSLHEAVNDEDSLNQHSEETMLEDSNTKSWWRVSLASPRLRDPIPMQVKKGIFYCVIYLKPGDYHRVHSPVDWHVLRRRHFPGHLFPQNERAVRTIRNLYVENERVVLEGQWKEGFIALAAIGATNVGSIKLFIEPELQTNRPNWRLQSEPPDERMYEPKGIGVVVKKGEEVAAFNMGSTVVLVFQAPISESPGKDSLSSNFKFCVQAGDKIRVGEAIGRWGK